MKYRRLLIFVIIAASVLLLFVPSSNEAMDPSKNFMYSLISFISIIAYLSTFRKTYKTWVRFETLFLIGFIIVHFQIPFLYSIGIQPANPSFIWLDTQVVNFATWLSALAIHIWMMGSIIATMKGAEKINMTISENNQYNIDILDYLLLFSFIGFFGLAGSSLMAGAHDGMGSWGEGASYFMILLRVCLYFRIFLFFKNLKKLTLVNIVIGNVIFLVTLLLYTVIFLFVGDRGPFLQVAIVVMLCYGVYVKNVSLLNLLFLLLVGAILLSIIGLGRNTGGANMFEAGYTKFQDSSINPTEELASSVRIMYRALSYFPDTFGYFYGLQFFIGLLGILPFASGFFISTFNIPSEFTASSRMFTFIGQGNNVTYGEGTEILSDIYINFGVFGVLIVMFFYGYSTGKISLNALRKNSDKYFLILIILTSTAIYINRAQFLMPLKDIVYMLLVYSLVRTNKKRISPSTQ